METLQSRSLAKETTETFLLLIIAGLILSGYLGVALALVQAVR